MVYHARLNEPRPLRQFRAAFFVTPDGVAIPKARPLTPNQRKAIFERDENRCQYCGVAVRWLRWKSWAMRDESSLGAVDHVVPRARGGQNDPSNLVLACERCNASKGAT